MFGWSIFDSHHIIKYLLFIVIHRKNFYVEIFCTNSLNNDASERYDLLARLLVQLDDFLAIVPAKGKKAGKGKGRLRVTAPDRKRPKG